MSQTSHYRIGRREFLKNSVTAAAGAGCLGGGFKAEARLSSHTSIPDQATQHNMLIVGQQTVFLSHLPMFRTPRFDSPHRYQVLLEATFTQAGSDPQAAYANDRQNNPGTKIYTLNPDNFVLPDLVSASANPPVSPFKAKIFRGHLEKPVKKLLAEGVSVTVKKVIHFREFNPGAPPLAQLEYLLFGKGKELFLAHFITRPPDFDQILSVSITGHNFTDEELSQGMRIVFRRPNSIPQRLRERQEAAGELRGAGGAAQPLAVRVKAGVEFYFEEGELRVPAVLERQTPAEKEAGFP